MLQAMRDKVMGWLGWIIIGLVIITFALFGLGSYLQNKTRVFVAKVNETEVTPRELQMAYQRQRAQMEQMLGDAYRPGMFDESLLKKRALDSLIQRQLVLQAAQENKMAISDQLLAASIQSIPALQEEGKFSEEKYKRLLYQQGQTPAGFEYETRQLLQAEQLINGIASSAFVTTQELSSAYRLQDQKRDFSYLIVSAGSFEKSAEVSDQQIQDYYEKHGDEFIVPERVRLAYLRLNSDELSKGLEVDENKLLEYYEEKKQSLISKEQRRASHILIKVAADADEDSVAAARSKAEELLKRIRSGEDFAKLAREYSDDPGSASQGGDLGFFAAGAMVPEFDKVVFEMQAGDVSDPVRTQFGFHIIRLEEIRGSRVPELDEVRSELVAELQKRQAEDLFYEQVEQLTDLTYEVPDSLDSAAEALGLEIKTSDWISAHGGPGIGQYPALVAAAFSDDVLEAGNNSEPIEVGNNDVIVVRVEEREAAKPSALEEVKGRIGEILKKQYAKQQALARGEELLAKVREGSSIETLAEQDKVEFKKAEGVTRAAPELDPQIAHEAFRLERPVEGGAVDKGFQLSNGDYVIVQLTRVEDADPQAMAENVRTQMLRGFENMRSAVAVSTMAAELRTRAEIVIPEQSE